MMTPTAPPPADVFTPLSALGGKAKNVATSIGKAMDDYEKMNVWLEKKANREKFRQEINKKYGLAEDMISKDLTKDELGNINFKLRMADDKWQQALNARVNKQGSMPTQQMIRTVAAGATDDYFYKYMGDLESAITGAEKAAGEREEKDIEEQNRAAEEGAVIEAGKDLPPGTTETGARQAAAQTKYRKRTPTGYTQARPGLETIKSAGMFGQRPVKEGGGGRSGSTAGEITDDDVLKQYNRAADKLRDIRGKEDRYQSDKKKLRKESDNPKTSPERQKQIETEIDELDGKIANLAPAIKTRRSELDAARMEADKRPNVKNLIGERVFPKKAGEPAAPADPAREARRAAGAGARAKKRRTMRTELDKEPMFQGGDEAIRATLRKKFLAMGKNFDALPAPKQKEAIALYRQKYGG